MPAADFLQTELVMHRANHDPHAYGLVDNVATDATGKSKRLPRVELNAAQKAANWCYLNPFKMVGKMRGRRSNVSCRPSAVDGCLRESMGI